MAIASCSVKIISRGKGRSAVAAAAYRAGQEMRNEYDGLAHDYTRKTGIIYTDILTPAGSPEWSHDRQKLWNMVEQTERRKDAQLAREVMIALPRELTTSQNIELARDYAQRFVEQGMIADVSVHDSRDGNPHAHIMLTLRPLEGDSFGKKCREWNSTEKLVEWREQYANLTNQYLDRFGHDERIDSRSYESQGIDLIPSVHLGHHAHSMEQKGIPTERGEINRGIQKANQEIEGINSRIAELDNEIKKEQESGRENELKTSRHQTGREEPKKAPSYESPVQQPTQHSGKLSLSEQRKLAAREQEQQRQREQQQTKAAVQRPQQPPSVHRPHEGRTFAQQRRVAQERERQRQADAGQGQLRERPGLSEQRKLAAQEPERRKTQEQPGGREAPAAPGRPPPLRRRREEKTLAQQRKASQERDSKMVYEKPSPNAIPHKPENERSSDSTQKYEGQQHHTRQKVEGQEPVREENGELERKKWHDRKI